MTGGQGQVDAFVIAALNGLGRRIDRMDAKLDELQRAHQTDRVRLYLVAAVIGASSSGGLLSLLNLIG